MNWLVIGLPLAGAAVGGVVGLWAGFAEGGDFNFAPVIYGPVGALVGGFAGVVAAGALT